MVRSSASVEDSRKTAAPGVFSSVRDVAAGPALFAAVRSVLESGRAPAARAFLAAHGLDATALHMAVVVQEQVSGVAAGVIYTRSPDSPDSATQLLEVQHSTSRGEPTGVGRDTGLRRAAQIRREDGAIVWADPGFPLDAEQTAAIGRAALAAEGAIGADLGADVEWVLDRDGVWVVQARPQLFGSRATAARAPLRSSLAFSRAAPEITWRWDATHNPEPLSPAQAGLVRRVDDARLAPFRMRVVEGYLYTAETPAVMEAKLELRAEELRARFDEEIRPSIEHALADVESDPAPDLGPALAVYDRVYYTYASVLAPLLSRARRALPELLARELGDDRSDAIAVELLASAAEAALDRLIARTASGAMPIEKLEEIAGPLSPIWDVATPTFGETPEVLERAVERHRTARSSDQTATLSARVRSRLRPRAARRFDEALELSRVARELGEVDDLLFGRAQAIVRRALLARASRWALQDRSDVFFVRLSRVVRSADQGLRPDPDETHRLAEEGRRTQRARRRLAMPLSFRDGAPLAATHQHARSTDCWQGRGLGPRVRGTVLRADELSDREGVPTDAVLVAPTVTPAMALLIGGVRCIVTEHGGLLDHGAALARELGIPCVVGCTGVWTHLETGDRVWVDGEAGVVARILPRNQ